MTTNPIDQLPPEVREAFEKGWRIALDMVASYGWNFARNSERYALELEQFARDYHEAHPAEIEIKCKGRWVIVKDGENCSRCGSGPIRTSHVMSWKEGVYWRRVPKSPDNGGAK